MWKFSIVACGVTSITWAIMFCRPSSLIDQFITKRIKIGDPTEGSKGDIVCNEPKANEDEEWGHFVFIDEQPRAPVVSTQPVRSR